MVGILAGCSGDNNEGATNTDENTKTENQSNESTGEESEFPVTLEDANGEVTIEEEPEAIVSLIPSNTEVAFALGLDDQIVGVTDNDDYPEEVSEKEKVGGMELNIEAILALEPDLVLAHETNDPDGIEQLEDSGLTVLTVSDAQSFDETYGTIEMISEATGTASKGEEIVTSMKEDLKDLEEKADEIDEEDMKKVFVEISPEPEIFTPGANTFQDEILSLIHAENIASDEEGWVELNEEAIIEKNPEVIVVTYDYTDDPVGDVLARDAWGDVDAIRDEEVIEVDANLVSRPGPRLVEGAETLAKAIYPEVFGE